MITGLTITPIYDILLRGSPEVPFGLYHVHLATAEQLCRLHYSMGSLTTIKARLKTLAEYGYVARDVIPSKQRAAPYYYTLGAAGVQYLRAAGLDVSDAFRTSKEVDKNALFVDHTLELNDMLVACALLERAKTGFHLHSFIHERELKRTPYRASWKVSGHTDVFALIPDAFLDIRYRLPSGKHRRQPILLEHDRGTEGQRYFQRRIRAYITFLKSAGYKQQFGVDAITVAFSTFKGIRRLREMLNWTQQELKATSEPPGVAKAFQFATFTKPLDPAYVWLGRCWYTPYYTGQPPQPLLVTT